PVSFWSAYMHLYQHVMPEHKIYDSPADRGSALTAGHFLKSAKSNQKRFAPPLGTSLRLGVPARRLESVGRRNGPSLAQCG
ncbi:hypothetical protein, partial [Pseudomonas poae]|uniref:hypothetical protein n=1 Tax=Pseudomonas poae TaxID=200451 RepID=UPI001EE1B855